MCGREHAVSWLFLQAIALRCFLSTTLLRTPRGKIAHPRLETSVSQEACFESALCRVPVILLCRWLLLQAIHPTVLRPPQGKGGHRRRETSVSQGHA